MKMLVGFVLSMAATLQGAELKIFAPAVEFKQVEWWGTNLTGGTSWYAGADNTASPANLGGIQEGRITGWQELRWQGRTYDIQSVSRTAVGAVEVVFSNGKFLMTRTPDGFYIVDVFPPETTVPVSRFKTSRKATAHDAGER